MTYVAPPHAACCCFILLLPLSEGGRTVGVVLLHFSEPLECKDEVHLRSAIYLAAESMLMGWEMEPPVGALPFLSAYNVLPGGVVLTPDAVCCRLRSLGT